jgi:ribosomal-protein-alanine N-acetyltransferase
MNLAVSPNHRQQGIGQALIKKLISHLQQSGVIALLLEVRVTNTPAIALYEKMGFVQVGRRPKYYHNPREDALILRKELRP